MVFRSKRRPIVFPQSEHLRLAGDLALFWGNGAFDAPPVERVSFVAGVALHDRGYGPVDSDGIGEMTEERWLAITRRGFAMQSGDPIADMIVRFHLRRLASYEDTPGRRALCAEMDAAITAAFNSALAGSDLSWDTFERLDCITRFCDCVSFDFCFEAPVEGSVSIYPWNRGREQVEVGYRVEEGRITIDSWPLSVPSHAGYLVGYLTEGYPQRQTPVVVPYSVVPARYME
jgi:hypothetical protein